MFLWPFLLIWEFVSTRVYCGASARLYCDASMYHIAAHAQHKRKWGYHMHSEYRVKICISTHRRICICIRSHLRNRWHPFYIKDTISEAGHENMFTFFTNKIFFNSWTNWIQKCKFFFTWPQSSLEQSDSFSSIFFSGTLQTVFWFCFLNIVHFSIFDLQLLLVKVVDCTIVSVLLQKHLILDPYAFVGFIESNFQTVFAHTIDPLCKQFFFVHFYTLLWYSTKRKILSVWWTIFTHQWIRIYFQRSHTIMLR